MPTPTIYELANQSRMNAIRERLLQEQSMRRRVEQEVSQKMSWLDKLKAEDKPLEEPWIDPVSAASGGFGGSLMSNLGKMAITKALTRAAVSGATGAAADYPIGLATEGIGQRYPQAALPFNILAGMGSGMTLEKMAENAIMNPQSFRKTVGSLANETGSINLKGGDDMTTIKVEPGDITTTKTPESPKGGNPFKESVIQEPVYHGTWKKIEGPLSEGFFTENRDIAKLYTKLRALQKTSLDLDGISLKRWFKSKEPRIYEVFLNIEKPFDITSKKNKLDIIYENGITPKKVINKIKELFPKPKDPQSDLRATRVYEAEVFSKSEKDMAKRMFESAFPQINVWPHDASWLSQSERSETLDSILKKFLKEIGFDGVVFKDPQPGDTLSYYGEFTTYIPFSKEQIKFKSAVNPERLLIFDEYGNKIGRYFPDSYNRAPEYFNLPNPSSQAGEPGKAK